jgi:hypothetical protein
VKVGQLAELVEQLDDMHSWDDLRKRLSPPRRPRRQR